MPCNCTTIAERVQHHVASGDRSERLARTLSFVVIVVIAAAGARVRMADRQVIRGPLDLWRVRRFSTQCRQNPSETDTFFDLLTRVVVRFHVRYVGFVRSRHSVLNF